MRKETEDAIREYKELIDAGYTEGTALELIKIAEFKLAVDALQGIRDGVGSICDRVTDIDIAFECAVQSKLPF